jgi:hypothetical protein
MGNIPRYRTLRIYQASPANDGSWLKQGYTAYAGIIPNYYAKQGLACGNYLGLPIHTDPNHHLLAVESHISCMGTPSNFHPVAHNRGKKTVQVRYIALVHDEGLAYFCSVSNKTPFSNHDMASNIGPAADHRVSSDNGRASYNGAPLNSCALFYPDVASFQPSAFFHLSQHGRLHDLFDI